MVSHIETLHRQQGTDPEAALTIGCYPDLQSNPRELITAVSASDVF